MGFELYIRTPIKMNPTLKEALRSGEIELRGIHRNKEYKELSPQLEKTIEEQRLMLEEALGFDLGIHKMLSTYYNAELKAVLKYNKKFNEKLNLRTEGEVLEEMQKIITLFESKKIEVSCKKYGLNFIQLITPSTPRERLEQICERASGFLYYVSLRCGEHEFP